MKLSISRLMAPDHRPCAVCGLRADPTSALSADRKSTAPPLRRAAPQRLLQALCADCRASIPWIASPVCRICGRPVACGDCSRIPERHFMLCRSAVRYDAAMKAWLALYKYRGSERLESVLASQLAFAYERLTGELGGRRPSAIVPVPLSAERLADRGFNQAERMAAGLSDWYGVPLLPALSRTRHTEKQSLKGRRSRLADMRGKFAVVAAELDELGRRAAQGPLLLVDDIYTTGSTMNESARTLRTAAPQAAVYGLAWARS